MYRNPFNKSDIEFNDFCVERAAGRCNIMAIDTGTRYSGIAVIDSEYGEVRRAGIAYNKIVLKMIQEFLLEPCLSEWQGPVILTETIQPIGSTLSWETFYTLIWAERFRAAGAQYTLRSWVTSHFQVEKNSAKKKAEGVKVASPDSQIREAIINRYGKAVGKEAAIGKKASKGPLFGISSHAWQALAIAIWYREEMMGRHDYSLTEPPVIYG